MQIKQLRWLTAFTFVVIFLSFITMSCSGGSIPLIPGPGDGNDPGEGNEPDPGGRDDPDIPDEGLPSPPSDHNLFGFAGIHFDSGTNAYVVDRSPDVHYNLTNALSEPLCPDCIEIETIEIDEVNHIIKLRISLRNPTTATYYDVRGICITNDPFISLIDPDGYITLFDDGGDIEWNPYYSYSLEKAERTFEPEDVTERIWNIHYTPGESYDFTLLVEGSHPGHCEDVARLFAEISDDTYITPFEKTGTLDVTVDDWQMDISAVHLLIPELDIELPMHEISAGQYDLSWDEIGFPSTGEYEFYVEAWSHNPDLLAIRQYEMLTVHPASDGFDIDSVEGYPYHGITPMRNNRSPYIGPTILQNPVSKKILSSNDYYYSYTAQELRATESGDYYYSAGSYYYQPIGVGLMAGGGVDIYGRTPDGGKFGKVSGGRHTVIIDDRLVTHDYGWSSYYYDPIGDGMPPIDSYGVTSGIFSYSLDLEDNVWFGGKLSENPWVDPGVFTKVYDAVPLGKKNIFTLEDNAEHYNASYTAKAVIRDVYTLEPVPWAQEVPLDLGKMYGCAVSPDGYIYFAHGYEDYSLICTDSVLNQIWSVAVDEPETLPVINGDGTIYIGTVSGISAFDPDGTPLWSKDVKPGSDMAIDWDGNLLVVTKLSHELLSISGQTGNILWGAPVKYTDCIRGIIVDAEGKIYVGTDERLYVFNSNGAELDSYKKWGTESNPVLGADGTLAVVYCVSEAHHYLKMFK